MSQKFNVYLHVTAISCTTHRRFLYRIIIPWLPFPWRIGLLLSAYLLINQDNALSLIHTAHVHARVHVVIEHVDFYDGIHTDCSHACARTSPTHKSSSARFVRGVAWILRGRTCTVHARGPACIHARARAQCEWGFTAWLQRECRRICQLPTSSWQLTHVV